LPKGNKMLFVRNGMPFAKADGKWICKGWAMKGPTGCMMNKEVPEPWQSEIEADYQAHLKAEAEKEKGSKNRRALKSPKAKRKKIGTTKPKARKKKQPSMDRLKELIKKESKRPRRKRGGVIGGISLGVQDAKQKP
jgi:hypothetical protein